MRYPEVEKFALKRGIIVKKKRTGRCKYEVYKKGDHSQIDECNTLWEVLISINEFTRCVK